MATDPVSPDYLEPDDFWETHKTKIIGYGSAIVLAIIGWGVYEFRAQAKLTASQSAYSTAKTTEEYRAVVEQFRGTTAAGNATLRLADKLREEKKYDEAVSLLREFIGKEKRYPLLAGAWTSLASTLELQEKPDEALAIYQEVVAKFPQESAAALALASQGRLLAAKGEYDAAERIYQDLTVRYPESVFAAEARRELQLLKQHQPVGSPAPAGSSPAPAASPTAPVESSATPVAPEATPAASDSTPEATTPEAGGE